MYKRLAIVVLALALVGQTADAAVRKVLMEEYTNAQCPPCRDHDGWMTTFTGAHHPDELIVVYYHMYWPGYDPFWYNNIPDNSARRVYYAVNAVPHNRQDGTEPSSYPYTVPVLEGRRSAAMTIPCHLNIGLSGTWYPGTAAGTIHVDLDPEMALLGDTRLFVALTERHVQWNGIGAYDDHDWTMRDLVTSATGDPVDMSAGTPVGLDYNWDFWAPFADHDDLAGPQPVESNFELVAWVQNYSTTQVLQAESIMATDMTTVSVGTIGDILVAKLGQNQPNPFFAATRIPIVMDAPNDAVVSIYGADGSLVRTLSSGLLPAGQSTFTWDGLDVSGSPVASGVYFVNLKVGGQSETRSMTVVR